MKNTSIISIPLFGLMLLGVLLPNLVQPYVLAAPSGITEDIRLLDSNANGQIDTITFEIYNPGNDTWQLVGAAPHGLSVTMDGNDVDIDGVSITSAADADPVIVEIDLLDADPDLQENNTDGVTEDEIELIYTQQTGDQTCTVCIQDGVSTEMNTIATGDTLDTDTEQDYAAPVISAIRYSDGSGADRDGRVSSVRLSFSEDLDRNSVLSKNDLLISNVGDFTGVAFGTDATDLITSDNYILFFAIDLDTPATVQDTHDNSGNFEISTQNSFYLEDFEGNGNSTLGVVGATIIDEATPHINSVTYEDIDSDGRVDQLMLTYSEEISGSSIVSANDLGFDDVGDFTGAAFGDDATDLVTIATTTVTVPLGVEAAVVDTSEDSGDIEFSSQNAYVVRGSNASFDGYSIKEVLTDDSTFIDDADVVVVKSNPTDNGTLRPLDKNITVTFSEEMDATTINELAEVDVSPDPGGIAFSTSTDGSGRTVLTIAHDDFAENAAVTVTVDAAAEALDGSTIGSDYVFDFTAKKQNSGSSGATPLTYSVEVTSPNGGETLSADDQVTITWQLTSNGSTSYVNIYVSYDGGSTWDLIAENTDNTGHFDWNVPAIATTNASIKVELTDLVTMPAEDTSDTTFEIISSDSNGETTDTDSSPNQGGGNPNHEDQLMGMSPVTGELEPIDVVVAGNYIVGASFDTVYFITEDLTRRPFMNEQLFFTWQDDFSNVRTVSDATLATLPLGSPMLSQPDVTLIKIMSVNDIYAVEEHPTNGSRAIKRLIETEDLAAALYGNDWADYVIDIEPTLFHYFDDGESMMNDDNVDLTNMRKRVGKN